MWRRPECFAKDLGTNFFPSTKFSTSFNRILKSWYSHIVSLLRIKRVWSCVLELEGERQNPGRVGMVVYIENEPK